MSAPKPLMPFNPFAAALGVAPDSVASFPPNSRYAGIATAERPGPDGEPVVYLRRRFIPQSDAFTLLQEHAVAQGDRLDNLASKYFGDPELSWRLCDANAAMKPEDLEEVGRTLRITLPEGIPGPKNA